MRKKAQNPISILLISKALLECSTLRELDNVLFQYTLPLFDARICIISLVKKEMIDVESTESIGFRNEHWLDDYRKEFFELDPLLRAPYTPFNYDVYITENIITYQDLQDTRYYTFMREHDVHSHMFVNLVSKGKMIGNVIYIRPKKMRPFQAEDMALAGLLQPYMSAALEKIILLEEHIGYNQILDSIISRSKQTGIMLLNNTLEPIHKNESADDTLALLYEENESNQKLPQSILVKCNELVSQIRRSGNKFLNTDTLENLRLSFQIKKMKEDVLVTLHPVPLSQGEIFLLVFMESKGISSQVYKLAKQCGLTQREIEVVNLMWLGMSSAEIADKLFISTHTVNNHIQAIFEKMAVRNRGSLVSKLALLT